MSRKILGIVGSYRKGGVVDSLVDEALAAASQQGAETEKIYLIDKHIEFCTNCRTCTQEPGAEPGECVHDDEMRDILAKCREADGLVLGSPVNLGYVTAVTRRFMERLVCMAYWPWGKWSPAMRDTARNKPAVLITSAAMPGIMIRLTTGTPKALKTLANMLGAKPIATLCVGLIACQAKPTLSNKVRNKARQAGRKLAH